MRGESPSSAQRAGSSSVSHPWKGWEQLPCHTICVFSHVSPCQHQEVFPQSGATCTHLPHPLQPGPGWRLLSGEAAASLCPCSCWRTPATRLHALLAMRASTHLNHHPSCHSDSSTSSCLRRGFLPRPAVLVQVQKHHYLMIHHERL